MVRTQVAFILMSVHVFCGCVGAADGDTTPVGFTPVESTEGSCDLVEERVLALDEEAPTRISGDDILLRAEGMHLSTLHYPDETTLPIEVNVVYSAGDVVFYDRDLVGSPDVEVVEECIDAVEVAVLVDVVSDDGLFNEVGIPVHLVGIIENESHWEATLDVSTLGGTYEVTEVDPGAFDRIELRIEGFFVTQGSGGLITGVAISGEEEETFDVAEWVPPGQEGDQSR
jgi:hypothetical protein